MYFTFLTSGSYIFSLFFQGFMYYVNDGVYGSFNCILFDHVHPKPESLEVSITYARNM